MPPLEAATKAATTTNSAGAGLSDDGQRRAAAIGAGGPLGSADLAKPIVFECDYDYQPDEDARLTVKWFKDKEAEPFYQWLPELNVRHFADWIRPLVDQTFVADPHDPLKRFRSLLIRRLSMNLTGQYTCLVSSLANQDSRSGSLVVYQAPRSFTFEHRIFPAPASLVSAPPVGITPGQQHYIDQQQQQHYRQQQQQYPMHRAWPTPDEPPFMRPPQPSSSASSGAASPTQFKGLPNSAYPYQWPPVGLQQQQQPIRPPLVGPGGYPANHQHHNHQHHQQALPPAATIVRPANNNSQNQSLTQTTLNGEQEESAGPTTTTTKIVYTHDGRPIRRKLRRRRQLQAADDDLQSVGSIHQQQQQQQLQQAAQISSWQLKKKLGEFEPPFSTATIVPSLSSSNLTTSAGSISGGGQPPLYFQPQPAQTANYAIQLHYFQCQATQVTPRPVMALLVKRGADSIAQYLHESSLVAIRPYQVNQSDLFPPSSQAAPMTFGCGGPAPSPTGASNSTTSTSMGLSSPSRPLNGGESHSPQPMLVTLYDITVSATVALNVSLPVPIPANLQQQQQQARQHQPNQFNQINEAGLGPGQFGQQQPAAIGVNTILNYRRGQRMSFECHLELTGTEFETRKRIGISEEEVYQFAEAEEQRRRLRLQQLHELQLRQRQQQHGSQGGSSSSGLLLGFGPVGSSASEPANGSLRTHERVLFVVVILLVTLLQIALPLRAHNLNSSPPQLVLWHLA